MINKAFEEALAVKLARRGEEMDLEIWSEQDRLFRAFQGRNLSFPVAIANAFTWTGHAVRHDTFFELAIDYLVTGNTQSLRRTEEFSGRFGPERLSSGLRSWRNIVNQLVGHDVLSCDAHGLHEIQEQCLEIASGLLKQGQISGIGPWLFCAPFKIIAAQRRDLWQSEGLDDVLMPLGLEVVRGIRRLIEEGCTFTQELRVSMLSEEEGGLIEGMATVWLAQDSSRRIAQVGMTRVLHVNSGLYLYGKDEL